MDATDKRPAVEPLWARHVRSVSSGSADEGSYDVSADVWVVQRNGNRLPAVECQDKRRTLTVTKAKPETTDTD